VIRKTPNQKVNNKKEGKKMINEKAVLLLEQIIKSKYKNVSLDNKVFNEEEFYYEFKVDDKISENDFLVRDKAGINYEKSKFDLVLKNNTKEDVRKLVKLL